MALDINVYLRGKGGTSRAKSKISAKGSLERKQITGANGFKKAEKTIQTISKATSVEGAAGIVGGTASKAVPVLATIALVAKLADKVVNIGANIYEAQSGENMISSNIKATSKAITSFGVSLISGGVSNWLYNQPAIRRQNYSLDYNRELYLRNVDNEKNRFI